MVARRQISVVAKLARSKLSNAVFCACLCIASLLFFLPTAGHAEDKLNAQGLSENSESSNARAAKRLPRYPLHLIDIWWDSPAATANFKELSLDFTISGDISPDIELFIAPLGLGKIGNTPLYGGVQTTARAWASKTDHHFIRLGRGGIFSRWANAENMALTLDQARGDAQARYEAGNYENKFISVRHAIPWQAGSYTFFLRKQNDADASLAGAWFSASVRENKSRTEYPIGELFFEGKDLSLGRSIASFVEVYGTQSLVPQLSLSFFAPKVDGKYRPLQKTKILYPPTDSPKIARFANGVQHGHEVKVEVIAGGVPNN